MRLNHNMASLNIYREQSKVFEKQSTALGRISSGLKINKTKDSPNGLAQSERLRMQIRGSQMAARNAQDGVSMLQTADGALGTINNMLARIRELAVQAGSGTNSPEDKAIMQQEISQMLKGIDDAANNMEFNGVNLLAPKVSELSMPIGANRGDTVKIELFDLRTSQIEDIDGNKLNLDKIDVTAEGGIDKTLHTLDKAIEKVLSVSSKFGALENRFESSYKNLTEISDKMQGAESSIRDADIAEEMIDFAKGNILMEAGNALMAQTNRFPQDILRILENMRK
ncbi:flagellin [Clostridium swellfunianum]|uniref:flagellin n=1 Tax=Clostridium swellfunianum TaxID=1367462 RepID=UPI00202DD9BC|nr:flagellin [Clostridium swellfunianum]MCM0650455.1 flagellin [Clostridium swellfunianum]